MTSIIIKHVFNHEHSCPYLKKFNVKYMVSKIEVIDKYSKEIIWRGMVRYVNETLYIEPEENYTFPMALNPGNYTIKIMTSMDLQVSEKVKIPPIVISKISE
ncbi:MAG: hypothetical protein B6V02_03445 [Thermoprotei archaeon ex4572_64]|nr:MAG: hypothetical protein B6V02_03445 [Thermoprotei archaeon ex4572_64]